MGRSERIIEILAASPGGFTAKEIASQMECPVGQISSPLSKLVAYGYLKRTRGSCVVYFFAAHRS